MAIVDHARRAASSDAGPDASPFHEGEQAVQRRAGTRARIEEVGRRVIRPFMPDQHRELFEQLPFLVLAAMDDGGQPWATVVTGEPGFVRTTPGTMAIDALPTVPDPVRAALRPGANIGVLGIELTTRRRNRMNGVVTAASPRGIAVAVTQSFGNCPKYVQARDHRHASGDAAPAALAEGALLSPDAADLVARSDTFFIGSTSGQVNDGQGAGADVSHRGGRPGFVRVGHEEGRTVLTLPDYGGNGFFNTLGNLRLEPRCGLLFLDLERGHLLQLAAHGDVLWDGPDLAAAGAERLLRLEIIRGGWVLNGVGLRWGEGSPSPHLPEPID